MAGRTTPGGSPARRALLGLILISVAVLAIVVAAQLGAIRPSTAVAASSSPRPQATIPASPTAAVPSPSLVPATAPPPSPIPTPPLVPAPLTGLLVTEAAALQHPIAVMIDDHVDARPQSGFNAASVVWHAPAEGGIPRYMLIFQDQIPADIGPVRSARQYYVEWASEWNALYVHSGGSPQAITTLSAKGRGQWVWNADEFRWGGRYLWRATDRFAPHNVYSDGVHLRDLATRLGAVDEPLKPAWSFAPDRSRDLRPNGGRITVTYRYETITYRYDAATNRYLRYIGSSKTPQVDRADGKVVAPSNVVILRMFFGALNDGHPSKHRLEAHNIGKGQAWIASNGRTIKGTWSKASATAPTLLFDGDGKPITLTAGQTFVQVLPLTYGFKIDDGPAPVWIAPQHRDP